MASALSGQGDIVFDRVTMRDVDFRKAAFGSFATSGCVFDACDFRDTVFDRRLAPLFASRPRSIFRRCRFEGADLRRAAPGQSRFEDCVFDGARLDEWSVTAAELVNCHFAGDVVGVTFHGRPWGRDVELLDAPRTSNEFRGNDFREAELIECAFIGGIALSQQRWPAGEDYVRLDRFQQRLTRGRLEILQWKDLVARGQALDLVQAASFLYREQSEVIARRVEARSGVPAEVQRRVWQVLATVLT